MPVGLVLAAFLLLGAAPRQQDGSIRGVVFDQDFDVPLPGATVLIVETGQATTTTDQGNYVFAQVRAGRYTLVFSKDGYARQLRSEVVVTPGQLTDVDVSLAGEFTDMDEVVVQDVLELGGGTELGLINLRLEAPSLLDSISSELMSRAGAGDAAAGLPLISGASVQEGKFAVIRGLPDRYVSSQLNGVRLPTADADKRAVELDQFPSAVIESIQVSKTFTPDQQGDASGGAVDVRLRGIPEGSLLQFTTQFSYNSQYAGSDFLTYHGGGLELLGHDDGGRDIQFGELGGNWDGAVGVSEDDAPIDYKLGLDVGRKWELTGGWKLGGFMSLFYEHDSYFNDDGVDDAWWVNNPGEQMSPQYHQGSPQAGSFLTSLFDVTRATQALQLGGIAALGLENENNKLDLNYFYSRTTEDTATLAEDTRGKEFFFPGYDPDDPNGAGHAETSAAPYRRSETLDYTERDTASLQLRGQHTLPWEGYRLGHDIRFERPELDWTLAHSSASLDEPDKRQFGSVWTAATPTSTPTWGADKPLENIFAGNLQRTWQAIEEDSNQVQVNVKFPFEQWSQQQGYLKLGLFDDKVDRSFNQDSFSNFNDVTSAFPGDFDDFWSEFFPSENHPITELGTDVDYKGDQNISAWYAMMDLPLSAPVSVITGARFESTELKIVNIPEANAFWFPPGADTPQALLPGQADVDFSQDDVLPALELVVQPAGGVTVRGAYAETVARQTFKELTPILQQEYFGGEVFIGNPALQMSALKNYDLRLDYAPYEGGLVSASWFKKDVRDPIEYVQVLKNFTFTTPVNYPKGELSGYELELRQSLGRFSDKLDGLALGANATFIDSEVTLPADEAQDFADLGVPMPSRDMSNAPEYLYNLYLTYDLDAGKTQFSAFYTVQGDTLVKGAGLDGVHFVPNVYQKEYGTLNLSLARTLSEHFRLTLQAKNVTNRTSRRCTGRSSSTATRSRVVLEGPRVLDQPQRAPLRLDSGERLGSAVRGVVRRAREGVPG
jgi:outer membrane receptor protein involved in Fe transport